MQVSVIGEVRNISQETVDSLPYLKMSRLTLWLSVGVFMWGFASGLITCPDGSTCSDIATCCKTERGYGCCQYPKAVCCADMLHCCPSGYRCNLVTQLCEKLDQPWLSIPMVKKDAAQKLAYPFLYKPALPSVPAFVIPMSEDTESMNEIPEPALTHVGSPEAQVIRCDSLHYCQGGMSCCQASTGQWNCCPYPLGQCCADGLHCCEYGYTCDASSLKCRNSYS